MPHYELGKSLSIFDAISSVGVSLDKMLSLFEGYRENGIVKVFLIGCIRVTPIGPIASCIFNRISKYRE